MSDTFSRMTSPNVIVEKRGEVCWITLHKHKRLNAITGEMYKALASAFDLANDDDDIKLTVMTGSGPYYSAGSDFSPEEVQDNLLETTSDAYGPYKLWVDRIIKHRKPLIALVNGPAVGIAVTTLGLCDAVIASDHATFWCPFTHLGLCPEAGSSSTFVKNLGYPKAARLVLFAEKISAQEAYVAGLVSKIYPKAEFQEKALQDIENYTKLAKQSLLASKKLLRPDVEVERLLTINRQEYEVLMEQMQCDETLERLINKFGKAKI